MQAFVVRVTIPESLKDLREQVRFHLSEDDTAMFGDSDLMLLLAASSVNWSVPRHVMDGDVILFQVSANARLRARKLRPELEALPEDDPDYVGLHFGLEAARKFAGCVISIGRIEGQAYYDTGGPHFRSRHYAEVVDLQKVWVEVIGKQPFSNWPEFEPHGSVAYRQFTSDDRYREFISLFDGTDDEPLPDWVLREPVTVFGNVKVTRDSWMRLARNSEFGFSLESAVRHYYADWLLRDISDRRILYSEVTVSAPHVPDRWVDNVILVEGTPVPVEVKVNAVALPSLLDQIANYRGAVELVAGGKKLPQVGHDIVLVVDQQGIYITDSTTTALPDPVLRRDESTPSRIRELRDQIAQAVLDR